MKIHFGLRRLFYITALVAIWIGVMVEMNRRSHISWRSSTFLASELQSNDPEAIMHGLHFLSNRKHPAGVPQALELLKTSDDYVWLNAATYLAVCGRQESIPYLIKAIRHTAWRGKDERLHMLRHLTGQRFGNDFDVWLNWWESESGNDTKLDWKTNLGHNPL